MELVERGSEYMVKLTAKNDWQNAKWYFYNMDQCDMFIQTLMDHGANINWNDVIHIPNSMIIGSSYRSDMDKDPRQRAYESLGWAFNSYCKDNPECDISGQIAESIMKA